jgi:hypothetical protein
MKKALATIVALGLASGLASGLLGCESMKHNNAAENASTSNTTGTTGNNSAAAQ